MIIDTSRIDCKGFLDKIFWSRYHPRPMGRYPQIAAWLRRKREERGIHSAAALARKAGLAVSHIATFERGEVRPRPATFRQIAAVLKLTQTEADEYRRLLAADSLPADVHDALIGVAPGLTLWKHLPRLLLAVPHDEIWIWDLVADELLVNLVRGLGSFLSALAIAIRPPNAVQRRRLVAVAHAVFKASQKLDEVYPNLRGPVGVNAAPDAASALPRAWRNELFAGHERTAELTELLREWVYVPTGVFGGRARLGACLKDERLNALYQFKEVAVATVINVHDAMVAHRLWSDLNLTEALGTSAESAQQSDLAARLWQDVDLVVRAASGRLDNDDPNWERLNRQAAPNVRLALRLYELPDLADRVIRHPREELAAALAKLHDQGSSIPSPPPAPPKPPPAASD